ncbi:hypothetical protein [Methylobacterium sp. R2-1]|uniref:hypothetical protein n=1 Tax=Methylobacterium sp. R2-1 TaxID=2587064 RepID=UPI0016101EFE|nr:hypothetical protein [Methylobacterium sp. R2-1]MBB2961050.1 flagellin-like hook-associated protein FlgL [Methylobacterium sp. R2-1]
MSAFTRASLLRRCNCQDGSGAQTSCAQTGSDRLLVFRDHIPDIDGPKVDAEIAKESTRLSALQTQQQLAV